MHRRFKAWMDTKRHGRQRGPQDPEMPFLPNPRPYALTPTPSQEQVTTLAEAVPFFRLPLELRRKILIHAFGSRTVHMDLVLTHPLREPLNDERSTYRSTKPAHRYHTENMHLYPYTEENLGLDTNQPRYVEGTEVLYGTNIFHISSKPLLNNITMLLPQRSLSMITSLETVLHLDTHEHQGKAVPSQPQLERGLHILDKHFPQLLSLHLGIRLDNPPLPGPRYEVNRRPVYLPDILRSIDVFVNRRSDLPEFSHFRDPFLLSIPESAYKDLRREIRDNDRYYTRKSGSQVWRHLSSEPLELDGESEIINATPNKGYWIWGDYEDRLPCEIRRQVLIEAFGDRTIHMDLTYNHPPMPGNKQAHAMIQEWRLGLDKSRPKGWYWRGCTCHRKPPPWHPAIATESLSARAVDKDRCCVGLAQCCEMWCKNCKELYGCWIGAMGWLQTCKQAYTEGIDVLYRTNTIHISSPTFLVDLMAYILPQRSSSIKSLEIIWFVETDVCIGKNLPRDKDLNAILLVLDNHFPNLKRLNLALKLGLSKNVETHYQYLFDILDTFFMRRVSDCMRKPFAVSIPYTVYVEMRREIVCAQRHEGRTFHWQIWRTLGGEYVLPEKPWITESFDTTPGARCNNGYWIYPGELSVPRRRELEQGSRA
ncbi:hypothetical protein FPHYL_3735 [Fusarium phyllophilum]|uniref:DUF7730 domain-containing protein n=1 Tax=Fusarium phyllophilum TaxID=47803 RepID=A0A8H5K6I5_9HYPO|nr:hypothetical protein FPHYL_3735 [Fusarium phyllophilum]